MERFILALACCLVAVLSEAHADEVKTNSPTNEIKTETKEREDDLFGLKAYSRLLSELAEKAKKPDEESEFLGKWVDARDDTSSYVFLVNGTFAYDFGHTKGKGAWRQSSKSAILLCYDDWRSKEGVFEPHKLAYIEDGVFKTSELDYTNDYVRESEDKEKPKPNRQDNKAE